eukprot:1531943-Rhodomonas_salina.1
MAVRRIVSRSRQVSARTTRFLRFIWSLFPRSVSRYPGSSTHYVSNSACSTDSYKASSVSTRGCSYKRARASTRLGAWCYSYTR